MARLPALPRATRIVFPLAGLSLLAAGCGGAATPTPAPGPATVSAHDTSLGKVLTDGKGRSLYLFEKDKPKESYCTDACAAIWPPFTTKDAPKAGSGVTASLLASTDRPDGSKQVTYHGHPSTSFRPSRCAVTPRRCPCRTADQPTLRRVDLTVQYNWVTLG